MVHLRHRNLLQTMAATIFPPFYRHRAARKQYSCRFIVTVRRGNNIFAILSSSRSAGTILLPFYRRRAAREQYFCPFIVTVRRGNDIFAVLSSPCGAGTIFLRFIVAVQRGNDIFAFYRHRAAREQYSCRFIVAVRRGNDIFAFQCLQCSCKNIPERFWLLQANCERSEMWREPRGNGGGPRAEGKMKSSHSK